MEPYGTAPDRELQERLGRHLQAEQQKSRLLQEELDSLRKVKGSMRSSGSTPPGSAKEWPSSIQPIQPGANAAFGGMDEMSWHRQEHARLTEDLARMQKENMALRSNLKPENTADEATLNMMEVTQQNADLTIGLHHAREENAKLRGDVARLQSEPNPVQVVHVERPLVRTTVVENGEHIEQLRSNLRRMQDENMALRRDLLTAQTQTPQVEYVKVERYIETPKIEVQVVEIESSSTIDMLISQKKDLELELQKRETIIIEQRAAIERLQLEPGKVEIQVIEVDSSVRMTHLIDTVNEKEQENAALKKQIIELGASGQKEVVYVNCDRIVEIPKIEYHSVEVPESEVVEQLQRALDLKDRELEHARAEVIHSRDYQRKTEVQLQDALKAQSKEVVLRRSAAVHHTGRHPATMADLAATEQGYTVLQQPVQTTPDMSNRPSFSPAPGGDAMAMVAQTAPGGPRRNVIAMAYGQL